MFQISQMKKILNLSLVLSIIIAVSLGNQAVAQDSAEGEKLFKNNCAACHNYNEEILVGPGLKGITERRDLDWIVEWVHNPQKVIASGDKYAVDLYNKYNKAAMTAYPNFSEGILSYINEANEADAAAAAAAPVASAAAGVDSGNNGLGGSLEIILIGLLLIMVLVLVALLSIVNTLSKLTGQVQEGEEPTAFMAKISENLKALANNSSVRTWVILIVVLFGTKETLDAAYGIGIHQGYAPEQPIKFSHKLHAGDNQINCNYCHTGVYMSRSANIPSANICMNCHNEIKRESPEIQKIYTAIEKNEPIKWVRVHNLPDLAYFNHSQHTNVGGLECSNCHGEIEKMEVVQQRSSLTMGWCIDCHRQTNVNAAGNAYYDKLVEIHNASSKEPMKVKNIGGLECSKCHY